MKRLIILFALIMMIVYSVKLFIRLNSVIKKAISINDSTESMTSQEASK